MGQVSTGGAAGGCPGFPRGGGAGDLHVPGVLQTTLVAPGSLPVSGLRDFPLRSPGRFTPLRLSHPQFLSRNPGVLQGRITNFYPFGTRFIGQWAVSPVGRAPAKAGRGKNGEGSSPAPGRGRLCPPLSSVPVSGQPPADLHPHRPRARQGEMPASLPSGAAALCQTLCVAALADAAPQTTATATATVTLLGF